MLPFDSYITNLTLSYTQGWKFQRFMPNIKKLQSTVSASDVDNCQF